LKVLSELKFRTALSARSIYIKIDYLNPPRVNDFFVPLNSFFIGGTAPYVYDDLNGAMGIIPLVLTCEINDNLQQRAERWSRAGGEKKQT